MGRGVALYGTVCGLVGAVVHCAFWVWRRGYSGGGEREGGWNIVGRSIYVRVSRGCACLLLCSDLEGCRALWLVVWVVVCAVCTALEEGFSFVYIVIVTICYHMSLVYVVVCRVWCSSLACGYDIELYTHIYNIYILWGQGQGWWHMSCGGIACG